MALYALADWASRIFIAFYFLSAAWFNFKSWDHHIEEFRRIGIGAARPALFAGLMAMVSGSILFLIPQTVIYGGALIIAFTMGASMLFHRYWTYTDVRDRTMHQQILFENIAHVGGVLAVVALHLT